MKIEEQFIAMAELDGWKRVGETSEFWQYELKRHFDELPQYLSSLDEMYRMELLLKDNDEQEAYCGWLDFITFHATSPHKHRGRFGRYHASVLQRVEAFLRTKKKWIKV